MDWRSGIRPGGCCDASRNAPDRTSLRLEASVFALLRRDKSARQESALRCCHQRWGQCAACAPPCSPVLLDVGCWMLDVGCSMLDVGCSMFDVGCWMFDVRCSMLDVGCSMFDVRCSMFDVRCSMFDVRCSPVFPAPPVLHSAYATEDQLIWPVAAIFAASRVAPCPP
jgi:hypothetical protein